MNKRALSILSENCVTSVDISISKDPAMQMLGAIELLRGLSTQSAKSRCPAIGIASAYTQKYTQWQNNKYLLFLLSLRLGLILERLLFLDTTA